jgi:quercetin dioxygenase-like cupin family protein
VNPTNLRIPRDLGVRGPVIASERPWVTLDMPYGRTDYRLVRVSLRDNCSTSIIRWNAGIRVPKHRHFGPVHAYTFSGRWHYAEYDWYATAGSYLVETPETEHSLVVDEDMEAMFTMVGGMVDLGPGGEVLSYSDAQTSYELYVNQLEAMGLPLPDDLLAD